MPSIRDLRDRKVRESFLGRQEETSCFRKLLEAADPEYAVLQIFGVGGVGKSTLLQQFCRVVEELGHRSALVDMQVHFGVVEILRAIREQIGPSEERAFAEFDRSLELYNDVKSKLQEAVGSLATGVVSGIREGVPLGIGALAVDAIGEEKVKSWLYRHLPRANADLYLNGDRTLTGHLVRGLNRMMEAGARLLVMFDTYEQTSEAQDEWLRTALLDSELSSSLLIVIAGRDSLPGPWQDWRGVTLSRELGPFSEEEARAYLERRGISAPEEVEAALLSTERIPWALALLADTRGGGELGNGEGPNLHAIGEKLVERFLSQLQDQPELRELVECCAVVRAFDYDLVRALWGREGVDQAMRKLRGYSFVIARAEGRWSLNKEVREFLDRSLRRRSPTRWSELNRRALELYRVRATSLPHYSREWNWVTLESLYHRLRLDEEEGIAGFTSLFEDAKRVYRYDLCSELLSNVEDVELGPASRCWLDYYRAVLASQRAGMPWVELHGSDAELYPRRDLPSGLRARVTANLGRYCYQITGEAERAVALLDESLAIRRELHDEQGEAMVLSHLAVAHAMCGALEEGRACARAAITLGDRLRIPLRSGWGHAALGLVESHGGASLEAVPELERGERILEESGHEFDAGVVRYHIGRALAARGDLDGALRELEAHLAAMQRYEKQALEARAMVDIAEILFRRGDQEKLPAVVAGVEAMILAQGNDVQRARLRLLQARLVLRRHQLDAVAEPEQAEDELATTLADLYVDALRAAASVPRVSIAPTTGEIGEVLAQLAKHDSGRVVACVRERMRFELRATLERGLPAPSQAALTESLGLLVPGTS